MRPRSRRGARRNRRYMLARPSWLEAHPVCEITAPGCERRASEIHHVVKRSQSVALQNDPRNWCAACHSCNMYVEAEPRWALRRGVWIKGGVTLPEYEPSPMISTAGYSLVELPADHPWSVIHGETTFPEHWVLAVCARWVDSTDQDVVILHRNRLLQDNRWANLRVPSLRDGDPEAVR